MLIHELEQKTGLDRATIRYYEREGLLKPSRQENKYREYTNENYDELMRIKLLRQLGLSIDAVKKLQQGGDFTAAMDAQIHVLEKTAQRVARARDICSEIKNAGIAYCNLDAVHYLEKLNNTTQNQNTDCFSEEVEVEIHPWRRYLARRLDYTVFTLLIEFILVVVVRIRPYGIHNTFLQWLAVFGTHLLIMPLNALLLSIFGTTLGKQIMGYRVESHNVGKMYFSQALYREFATFCRGMGLLIPFYEQWRLYKSYKEYRETGDLAYDEEGLVVFTKELNAVKIGARCAAVLLIVGAIIGIAMDSMKPTYLGDLTIEEFAENYNDTLSIYLDDGYEVTFMDNTGEFLVDTSRGELGYYLNNCADRFKPFDYVTEKGIIKEIHYSNTWSDIQYNAPLMKHRYIAALAIISSQYGINARDLTQFSVMYEQMASSAESEGGMTMKNVEIQWKLYSENCINHNSPDWYEVSSILESKQELDFRIIIH